MFGLFRPSPTAPLVESVRAESIDRPLAEALRDVGNAFDATDRRGQVRIAAVVDAAFVQTFGHSLYDTQLHAGLSMVNGRVAEMATGEGKTFAAAIPAAFFAAAGRGTHVATANDYLVARDCELLRPIYAAIGLTAAPLPEQDRSGDDTAKRTAYAADITYGTGHEFGFDYLRERLAEPSGPLGVAERLRWVAERPSPIQRAPFAAVIDEVDHVLLDDALSPLILSCIDSPLAPDAEAHRLARQVALSLPPESFLVSPSVKLLPGARERMHEALTDEIVPVLARPWQDYVQQAVQAEFALTADVDYQIGPPKPPERGGDGQPEVELIDPSTGRIFADRTWSDGLHQAVEAKEQLPIRGGTRAMARITKQRLFGGYDHLCGMTGTATGCEREFRTIYEMAVEPIPLRLPSRRLLHPLQDCATADEKWAGIAVEALDRTTAGQPVLIGTASIASSRAAEEAAVRLGLRPQVLNGQQDEDEAAIVALAGHAGTLTIATNLAGRGTDIALDDNARDAGGLHVIVAEACVSRRVERQLVGRSARQGDPGSASFWTCGEDRFLQQQAPWLAASLGRGRGVGATLRRVQRAVDRESERQRIALWRQDVERDDWIDALARAS